MISWSVKFALNALCHASDAILGNSDEDTND